MPATMQSESKLRIGLLGAANVAIYSALAPARETGVAEIFAVAARDPARAAAYAETHGIPNVAESYEALLADPRVEAIYNALPPALHAEWTIKALRAGKHVLCEKPFCLDADEARTMVAAAEESDKLLVEAFHYRHHPLFERVLEIVRGDAIGAIERITMTFEAAIPERPGEIRYDREMGGGALLDIGTYCMHIVRQVAGEEPRIVSADFTTGATAVDTHNHICFDFPSGATGEIHTAMTGGPTVDLMIIGTNGTLQVINPVAPQFGHVITLNGAHELSTSEATFNFQLRAFVAAVCGEAPQLPTAADSIAQMEALDAARTAARAAT